MSEFIDYSKKIVTNFLQTVVIIDDEAFLDEGLYTQYTELYSKYTECTEKLDSSGLPSTMGRGVSPEGSQSDPENDPPHFLNAKTLSDTFADYGLMCTALRPIDGNINLYKKVLKKADIVILDWKLKTGEADGATVKGLIKEIIKDTDGNTQKALRNIVIYSGEEALIEKLVLVKNDLETSLGMIPSKAENFLLEYEKLQIKIYAKEATRRTTTTEEREILKSEEDLAKSIIDDFVTQVAGLVPNMAIASLTQIRNNTHKILGVFSKELDAAYLSHRALLPNTLDAESFILDIFISELQSILEDSEIVNSVINIEQIMSWINHEFDEERLRIFFFNGAYDLSDEAKNNIIKQKLGLRNDNWDGDIESIQNSVLSKKEKLYEVIRKILEKGFEKIKCQFLKGKDEQGKDLEPRHFTKYLYSNPENALQMEEKLSILSSMQTKYTKPLPYMTLGTVIKDQTTSCYFLCIVPRCDAARVGSGNTSFLFLPLTLDDEHFELIVQDDNHKKFSIEYKIKKLITINLKKTTGNNITPLKAQEEDSNYIFVDENDRKYKWIADVKRDKAQAISNKFAAQLSRVGFNESEYLRRAYQ